MSTAHMLDETEADAPRVQAAERGTALRRAAAAHGQHDANWPDWYPEYIVREQAGKELPS